MWAAYKRGMHIRTVFPQAIVIAGSPRSVRIVAFAMIVALAGTAQAQSVQPNRYGTPPPIPKVSETYESQRQGIEDAQRRQDEASRRAEQDRIGLELDANRKKLEADRARTERRRAATRNPAESERMRLDYEQRRQAYEREREELERQRADAQARPPARP